MRWLSCVLICLLWGATLYGQARTFDVVVYGGTGGGVISAVSAAREGLKVALLEPGRHLGGMVTGGLSATDHGRKETVGGYSLEFYERLGRHYGREIEWYPEPHVAEKIFQEMVQEAKVTVLLQHRLKERDGVGKKGTRITEIRMENGSAFQAEIFLDASYEGDLMAQAGVSYTWGREGVSQYNESLAGVRPKDRNHQFDFPVSAYDENGKVLPEIQNEPRGELGAGDKKVQAYNFRMILTKDPNNKVPFPKPPDYDAKRYELLARFLAEFVKQNGRPPRAGEILFPRDIANHKWDFNNRGPFSTYYIREARRMAGDFVMTQKDIQTELVKRDVIGMGSYNSDSHNVQRYVTEEGNAQNEGNMEVPVTPYQIPYRVLLPKKSQATNLLVPVCFSASHVTYSTLRMEPVYMIIGQAAGLAAKMAIDKRVAVQDIDTAALTARLRGQRAGMEWNRNQ